MELITLFIGLVAGAIVGYYVKPVMRLLAKTDKNNNRVPDVFERGNHNQPVDVEETL